MYFLYGIKFDEDKKIYYTTKEMLKEWKKYGAFRIIKKQLVFDFLNKVFKINIF